MKKYLLFLLLIAGCTSPKKRLHSLPQPENVIIRTQSKLLGANEYFVVYDSVHNEVMLLFVPGSGAGLTIKGKAFLNPCK